MGADGSNPTEITFESERGPTVPSYARVNDDVAKWSPDGSQIALKSDRNYDPVNYFADPETIYITDSTGANTRRFITGLSSLDPSLCAEIWDFDWSPDGTEFAVAFGKIIAFVDPAADPCEPAGFSKSDLYLVKADGGGLSRLTNSPVSSHLVNTDPTWSPDGSQIAFVSWDQSTFSKLVVMNADGSNQHAILQSGSNGIWSPSWSPDGTKILFVGTSDFPGTATSNNTSCLTSLCRQIFTVNPDGTDLTELTNSNVGYDSARWSPDGSKILFVRNLGNKILDPYQGEEIFVMNADGRDEVNISNRWDRGFGDFEVDWQPLTAPSNGPPPSVLGFEALTYLAPANAGSVPITIIRTGNLDETVSCDYKRVEFSGSPPDGTVTFAPGETSKTINVFPGFSTQSDKIGLFNNRGNATFVGGFENTYVIGVSAFTNPLEDINYFVLQQYHDFLSREPDESGFEYWASQTTNCLTDQQCIRSQRIATADAFFFEPEFQDTGAFIYRLYQAAFGTNLNFAQFSTDRAQIIGGANLDQSKNAFAVSFVGGDAFVQLYPRSQTADQFVDALLQNVRNNAGVDLASQRAGLIALNDGTDAGRAAIIRQVAENASFVDAEYDGSFVLNEYFGFLRRDPDIGGLQFWLNQMNGFPLRDIGAQHAMVCSFITSAEYQQRFSSIVSHTNAECGP